MTPPVGRPFSSGAPLRFHAIAGRQRYAETEPTKAHLIQQNGKLLARAGVSLAFQVLPYAMMIDDANKRVVLTTLGGLGGSRYCRRPRSGANELRIRILACGVTFADVLMRRGLYSGVPPLPYSQLRAIVGIVDASGASITGWQSGDLPAAILKTGGYSLYRIARSELVRVPPGSTRRSGQSSFELHHGVSVDPSYREAAPGRERVTTEPPAE